jgi:hypothetical protein
MAKLDPHVVSHLEWLGFVRPTGLVVSAPALVRAGAILDSRDIEGQRLLRACTQERTFDPKEGPAPYLPDFQVFAQSVLGWSFSPKGFAGTSGPIPQELEVTLTDYGETLRPDFAVRELEPQNGAAWQLLVRVLDAGEDFDRVVHGNGRLESSEHGRLERLLRQTRVPAGLLFNGRSLRLISAPYGESSGWVDFRVADMVQTAGRPISTALRLLLGQSRLLSLPRGQRLPALLSDSRKFQNEVSERLAEQVLHALYEFVRGFQAAHDASGGQLLREPLTDQPDEVYHALLTVILRLVFLLYAEERDMLPEDDTFLQNYSLAGLYERLREDAALYPETMDQRYGAWAQLLVLFRMVHDGADSGALRLPRRHGALFDPDRFPFLEGRGSAGARQLHERINPPLVPDGTIYRAFEKLFVLDGERISYRALDVEQIGSVYETMMGFRLETATGRSVAIKAQKKQGAPSAVDLDALLRAPAGQRDKWLQEHADRKVSDAVKKAVASAASVEDLHAALLPVIDLAATPDLVPKGAVVLQPSEARRRSGSHYTPRELTEPIVRTTLEPILKRLRGADGRSPRPVQILDLKVCDPAMGSGAFLVETCRQLGDALVDAWHAHGEVPTIPPDEDEVVFARRLIAQRCLYGVDKNPVAVDLAKVSLWLVTLAQDHALTFLDHALRHGDSLVGLTRRQIEALQWDPTGAIVRGFDIREPLDHVFELRERIRQADETVTDWEIRDLWDEARHELSKVRLFGDLVLTAFFESDTSSERERKRAEYAGAILKGDAERYRDWLDERRVAHTPLVPFHWDVEFPEVFARAGSGFDAIVGNPPFLGGRKIRATLGDAYCDWLPQAFEAFSNNADLVAGFFRRAFELLRPQGCLGLIATNTIAQGDTRRSGLTFLRQHGACIYGCVRRLKWPGAAAVVVSVLHVAKDLELPRTLDGRLVPEVTAFLFHAGGDADPAVLLANSDKVFQGVVVAGAGFLFDDSNEDASPTALLTDLQADERNKAIIRPYLGGEEINSSPTLSFSRWVIDFSDCDEARAREWPELIRILEAKVLPYRQTVRREAHRRNWWQFGDKRPMLRSLLQRQERVLVNAQVSQHFAFAFQPTDRVFAMMLNVFIVQSYAAFCGLQSRTHEIWARFFGSSLEDRLRYTPSDCFDTFPFPENWESATGLEDSGKAYYDFRAALMIRRNEGLTDTYNRFHDPDESAEDIINLRSLHADLDQAVLRAYGWTDIPTACDFFLDYEIDEADWGNKKKPYRYRWPDEVRDEVLARLLELNADRAKEEARSGAAAGKSARKPRVKKPAKATQSGELFS